MRTTVVLAVGTLDMAPFSVALARSGMSVLTVRSLSELAKAVTPSCVAVLTDQAAGVAVLPTLKKDYSSVLRVLISDTLEYDSDAVQARGLAQLIVDATPSAEELELAIRCIRAVAPTQVRR